MNELLTVTGKPITVASGFRLPVVDYQKALTLCQKADKTFSAYTAELWRRELKQREAGDGATDEQ